MTPHTLIPTHLQMTEVLKQCLKKNGCIFLSDCSGKNKFSHVMQKKVAEFNNTALAALIIQSLEKTTKLHIIQPVYFNVM